MSVSTLEHEVDQAPREYRPGMVDRRRPGRMENVSPELIALMRKPTPAARMRVALYDAPGFMPAIDQPTRPGGLTLGGAALAVAACGVMSAGAFRLMLLLWG